MHGHGRVGEVAHDRVMREQVEVLEHEPEMGAGLAQDVLAAVHRMAVLIGRHHAIAERERPAVERFEQRAATQQRRLAAAAGADDGEHFAFFHGKRYVFEHLDVAEALTRMFK